MSICKVFIPYGALGAGISEEAFQAGLDLKPDIISCDAGSTDSGPFYLGTGNCKYSKASIKTDLRRMIIGAHKAGIPITIGSAGTCGTDNGVDELGQICEEICQEEGIHGKKLVKIYTEQSSERLADYYAKGKIRPLGNAPQIDASVFEECTHIVALSGAEPFIEALKNGADIVICGRATDTAVIAALPLLYGCDEASAWHGAKVCECGSLCTTVPVDGGVFLTVGDDYFTVEPTAAESRCTVYTVSAHLLYENSDPIHLVEPGVFVDTSQCQYEQINERTVKVTHTRLEHTHPYTMKLEGASESGYQTVSLVGVRDPKIMENPEIWISRLSEYMENKLHKLGFPFEDFSYQLRAYGWNAVYGGAVPQGYRPNELGVLLTVTAKTQELATQVAKAFNPMLLHFPLNWEQPLPSFAFPFSPSEIQRGKIYEFRLNHIVEIENPLELVRFEEIMLGQKGE
ncbi:MAG: acyclic terpene utilization AtuA family protein [Lachnospiraceae bacterium]|nr:acyclic terpene utilization AtuA family protein [Lachnospiraceae bacterium]